jgi:peptide/nickel transport system ATP-binding protein
VLNLFRSLQAQLGCSCPFSSQRRAARGFLCDRVAVMCLGKLVEVALREDLSSQPRHPYTRARRIER